MLGRESKRARLTSPGKLVFTWIIFIMRYSSFGCFHLFNNVSFGKAVNHPTTHSTLTK